MRTSEHARYPLDAHVNPSTCAWAALPTRMSSGSRASESAQVQVIGPTCTSKGPREQDAFTETEDGVTARRPPDALNMPRETTEAGPRRIPPLVACGDRAVGAEKSRYQQHVESYNLKNQVYAL